MNNMPERMLLIDLGSAVMETRQGQPQPPYYVDNVWGFGSRPDTGSVGAP